MSEIIFIIFLIINFLILLTFCYLLFLYLKTQEFFPYLFAHILNLNMVLSLDNIDNKVLLFLIPDSLKNMK